MTAYTDWEMAVKLLKMMGQDLIDRAEELIPDTEGVKDIDVWLRIPSLSRDQELPEIQISTNIRSKAYTSNKIMKLLMMEDSE